MQNLAERTSSDLVVSLDYDPTDKTLIVLAVEKETNIICYKTFEGSEAKAALDCYNHPYVWEVLNG